MLSMNFKIVMKTSKNGANILSSWFCHFESRIQDTAGTYAYGGQFSLIDACLVPQVYNALRFNVKF